MPQRIILDVDTGTDDAVALLIASLSPDLELIGATTVNGNVPVEYGTENTLRVLDHIGAKIPVFEGMRQPLVRPDIPRDTPSAIHGEFLELPPAISRKQQQHAVDWLIETYLASDGEIVLVAVGPLTNVAAALRKAPDIVAKIPEIVIMGGGHAVGNVTPSAEFNVWVDPEAARIALYCGRPIRLVTLDATHRALVSKNDCQRLRNLGTPAATAAASLVEKRIDYYNESQPMHRADAAPVHDALAVCAIVAPGVIQTTHVYVDVETRGELTDGRTVCDVQRRSGRKPNAHVALDADEVKFVSMMADILGRTLPS